MDLIAPRPATSAAPAPTPPPVAMGETPKPPATTAGVDDRNTAFRAVQGGGEMQSGEKLLVEAYAAIWVILFALVLLSWRRQRRLDDRMGSLEAAIDKARLDGGDPQTPGAAADAADNKAGILDGGSAPKPPAEGS